MIPLFFFYHVSPQHDDHFDIVLNRLLADFHIWQLLKKLIIQFGDVKCLLAPGRPPGMR